MWIIATLRHTSYTSVTALPGLGWEDNPYRSVTDWLINWLESSTHYLISKFKLQYSIKLRQENSQNLRLDYTFNNRSIRWVGTDVAFDNCILHSLLKFSLFEDPSSKFKYDYNQFIVHFRRSYYVWWTTVTYKLTSLLPPLSRPSVQVSVLPIKATTITREFESAKIDQISSVDTWFRGHLVTPPAEGKGFNPQRKQWNTALHNPLHLQRFSIAQVSVCDLLFFRIKELCAWFTRWLSSLELTDKESN